MRPFDPIRGIIGDDSCVVARDLFPDTIYIEFVVEIIALPTVTHPMIEARTLFITIFTHVPLSDVSSLVARLLQATRIAGKVVRILGEVIQHLMTASIASAQE